MENNFIHSASDEGCLAHKHFVDIKCLCPSIDLSLLSLSIRPENVNYLFMTVVLMPDMFITEKINRNV